MYKVVIVDDEEIIVNGLKAMLPWDKYECVVCGTALNGVEGLELIRRERPSIVLTDISMPQMDGLSMIAALKTDFPNMQIMILTGFRDFDYAREALHLGVTRLLVKPSKMEELVEALDTMCKNLRAAGISPETEVPELTEECDLEFDEATGLSGENARSFVVKTAMDYMRDNFDQHLRLEDVAAHVFVSQWHLSKLLNKHTGQNFSELLNTIRIDKAKEFLRDPEFRIGDIAEKVGFLDMAHFSRVFKKCTGMSPSEYRNGIN